jgi:hypothetical protein
VQREGKNKEKNKEVSNFKVWVNEFEGYLEKIVPEKVQKFPLQNSLIHACMYLGNITA